MRSRLHCWGAEQGDRGRSQSRPLVLPTRNRTSRFNAPVGVYDAQPVNARRSQDLTSLRARAAGGGLCRPCCSADWDRSRNRGVSDPHPRIPRGLQLRPEGRSRPGSIVAFVKTNRISFSGQSASSTRPPASLKPSHVDASRRRAKIVQRQRPVLQSDRDHGRDSTRVHLTVDDVGRSAHGPLVPRSGTAAGFGHSLPGCDNRRNGSPLLDEQPSRT